MKKNILKSICWSLIGLSALVLYGVFADNATRVHSSSSVVSEWIGAEGCPSKDLLSLLELFKVPHDGTLNTIVQLTQSGPHKWLREATKERWEIEELDFAGDQQKLVTLLERLGFINGIAASQKTYKYALVLGALASTMYSRLHYLVKEWERGVRFDTIIFLVGERPLNPDLENRELFGNPKIMPSTETEAAQLIWQQAQTEIPEQLATLPVLFISAPMKRSADGTLKRPTTDDTIKEWLALNPEPGKTVWISGQPYIGYQESVIKSLVPPTFEIEVIGSAAKSPQKIAIYLDSAARLLYQENKRCQK
jgi:hypothetical protein